MQLKSFTNESYRPPAQPIQALSIATMVALSIHALCSVVLFLALTERVSLLHKVRDHLQVSRDELLTSDALIAAVSRLHLAILIGAAVFFLAWFYRAHKNLSSFQPGPFEYSSAQAVWSFFIPLANLFQPYFVMKEIWQASHTKATPDSHYTGVKVSPMVLAWWLLLIGQGLLGWAAILFGVGEHSVDSLLTSSQVWRVSYIVAILGAIMASVLVYRVQRLQEAASESAPGGPLAAA